MATLLHIRVPEGTPAARRLAEALTAMDIEVEHVGQDLTATARTSACPVCETIVSAASLQHRDILGGEACKLCVSAADQIYSAFREAALRQSRELKRQMKGLVFDRRNGAEMPTFYAGF